VQKFGIDISTFSATLKSKERRKAVFGFRQAEVGRVGRSGKGKTQPGGRIRYE